MIVWAVAAMKGGVGKTTSVINLAGCLVRQGYRVLMIDLDPHMSLTSYLRLSSADYAASAYEIFAANAEQRLVDGGALAVPVEWCAQLAIVPGSESLFAIDRRFGDGPGLGLAVRHAMPRFAGQFDFCLLDCSPSMGTIIVNAIAACDLMIVPVQTEYLALKSVPKITNTLSRVAQKRASAVPYLVVPTMYDQRTRASRDTLAVLRATPGLPLWSGEIPIDTQFREASRVGRPLTLARPMARGARAYATLSGSLLSLNSPPAELLAS